MAIYRLVSSVRFKVSSGGTHGLTLLSGKFSEDHNPRRKSSTRLMSQEVGEPSSSRQRRTDELEAEWDGLRELGVTER